MVVIAKGRVSPSVATSAATIEMIGEWMSGLWDKSGSADGAAMTKETEHAQA
jgi:simple sugar transport system ATP-binding protein